MAQLATVGVYMFGLFVGSLVASRIVGHIKNPLRVFIWVEAGAAVVSLIMILGIPLADPIFRYLAQGDLLSGTFGAGLRGFAGGSLIFPATYLMGFGFPMAIKAMQNQGMGSSAASWVYGINTIGAAIGALIGGFYLVPMLGLLWGPILVVVVDLAVLYWVSKSSQLYEEGRVRESETDIGTLSSVLPLIRGGRLEESSMLIGVFLGGAVALGLEVLLFRLLGLVLGPTVRAFTIVVASYVLGLGLGSLAMGKITEKGPKASRLAFIGCWLGVGLLIILFHEVLEVLPNPISKYIVLQRAELSVQLLIKALVSFVVLLPITFAFGASYAAAVAMGGGGSAVRAARLYTSLTLGNIVGLLFAALWILPGMGTEKGIWLLGGVACFIPLFAMVGSGYKISYRIALFAGALILALAGPQLSKAWIQKTILSGPYMYKPAAHSDFRQVLFNKEDFGATVTVLKDREKRFLTVDGKVDGGTGNTDKITQSLLGVIPAALHPNPKKVLVIGLGTGQTVSEILQFQVESLDVAEISPAIEEAAKYFQSINREFWKDPRYRLIQADARTVLRYGQRKYDLIVSEPSNVWVPGVAQLFTREAFVDAREALNQPNGIFLQWLHTYKLDLKAFRMVLRTFLDVFPYVTLWCPGPHSIDALFIGSFRAPEISIKELRKRLAAAKIDNFMAPGRKLDEIALLRTFMAGPETLAKVVGKGEILRDSRPRLDYLGERTIVSSTQKQFFRLLYEISESPADMVIDLDVETRALVERRSKANKAYFKFVIDKKMSTRMALGPDGSGVVRDSVLELLHGHEDDQELRFAIADLVFMRANQYIGAARWEPARQYLDLVLELYPENYLGLVGQIIVAHSTNKVSLAHKYIDRLEKSHVGIWLQLMRGNLFMREGKLDAALTSFSLVLEKKPLDINAHLAMGICFQRKGLLTQAKQSYEKMLALDPGNKMGLRGLKELKVLGSR